MTSPITEISIAGTPLDLGDVDYSVQVQHGRNDVNSAPEASSCQIVVYGASGVAANVGDALYIEAYGFARFTGNISDIQITHLSSNPPLPVTTIIGMGNLAKLGQAVTGIGGYPHESAFDRAETILTDSGLEYLNGGNTALEIHEITTANERPQSCLDALTELSAWSGATFFDTPEGLISFEDYGNRGLTAFAGTWQAQLEPWSFYAQSWESFPEDQAAYTMPSNGVVWTPTWSKNLAGLINDVTVKYGGDGEDIEQSDDTGSIALYGRRAYVLDTRLRQTADAQTRAANILAAQALPYWNLGQISIRVDLLGQPDRDHLLGIVNGALLNIPDLPEPAPYDAFTGIVEGWAETYTPGTHVMTLSISDPRYSYETVTWGDVDPALTWAQVNASVIWYNVVTADDLAA
jgi:hypothetical protein